MKLFKTFILPVIILLTSCGTADSCRENVDIAMQMDFYSRTLNPASNVYVESKLQIDSIWVRGLGIDSLLCENVKNLNLIKVPLQKFQTASEFVVRFNDLTDTISVLHQNNDGYFISLECGCTVAHTIDEVIFTRNFIDSIAIINREINTVNAQNIKIFHY